MKNIYQHNIELEPIRINNADKATFSQKLIDLPYRGYEVEELQERHAEERHHLQRPESQT